MERYGVPWEKNKCGKISNDKHEHINTLRRFLKVFIRLPMDFIRFLLVSIRFLKDCIDFFKDFINSLKISIRFLKDFIDFLRISLIS